MRVFRALYLYVRLMTQHLKAMLEYQADFVIMVVAAALTQIVGFIFLWVVYQRIPTIDGWSFWEVALIYAMIYFTEGATSFLFDGVWNISGLVNRGELDLYLLRPVPPLLQIAGARVGLHGIGNMVTGGLIMAEALRHVQPEWTPGKILWALVIVVSAIAIRASINLASCSFAFWTRAPGNAFPFMVHSLSEFARFPLTIYSLPVQALIAVVVPYAFISFLPAAYLLGKPGGAWLGALTPLVAVYCVAMSVGIFHRGLRTYESSGN
jgi:ABC-2 type transport system permease protein